MKSAYTQSHHHREVIDLLLALSLYTAYGVGSEKIRWWRGGQKRQASGTVLSEIRVHYGPDSYEP